MHSSDLGTAEVLCGDRNLCARPDGHLGAHESFDGNTWSTAHIYAADNPANYQYHDGEPQA